MGVISLCGGYLLGDRLLGAFVAQLLEALAVELVEVDAIGLVGDQEVEDGPDEGEAAVLPGEGGPITLVRRLTSPRDRSRRFVLRHVRRWRGG